MKPAKMEDAVKIVQRMGVEHACPPIFKVDLFQARVEVCLNFCAVCPYVCPLRIPVQCCKRCILYTVYCILLGLRCFIACFIQPQRGQTFWQFLLAVAGRPGALQQSRTSRAIE